MKITIENTSKIVLLNLNGGEVPARVWQGQTESGIPVQAFITRIAPEIPQSDPDIDAKTVEFEMELTRCADPRTTVQAIPRLLFLD